jgi:hypothetical protein
MHGVMRKQRFTLYGIAALCSILLSLWAALKTSVINPDGICYLQSAEAMDKGLLIATHLCAQAKWPFYSILIFGVIKLTHFSSLVAAYVLNGLFSLITVIAFIAIVDMLTTKKRIVWLAALTILLAHEFNDIRADIVRDHGFWAFYLLSLLYFLRYFQIAGPNLRRGYLALLWSFTLLTAGIFRIEGFLFLLLLPFTVFLDVRRSLARRFLGFLQLNIITLLGAGVVASWAFMHPGQSLGRLAEIQFQLMYGVHQLIASFENTSNALAFHVLNSFSMHDASLILMGMFASWYLLCVISNVSLIYAVLIIYAWWKKITKFDRATRLVFGAYIFINVLITSVFLIENMFLAKRYLIALSLVLMVWVPFALNDLLSAWRTRKWPLLLALFFIAMYAVSGIFNLGYSKKYVREAGDWLALNAPLNAKIYSNDYQVLYYSRHLGEAIFTQGHAFEKLSKIAHGQWRQYDYLALRVNKSESAADQAILRQIKLTPLAVFQNERGDQVKIYEAHLKKDAMENKR